MISRRLFLASGAALMACKPKADSVQKRLAVTMDDFNLGFNIRLDAQTRNQNILNAFEKHNHKAAGFVTGRFVQSELGQRVLTSWSDAGHMLGNHTFTHLNSTDEDIDVIKADILKNHEWMMSIKGYESYFRFPFLAEGGDIDKVKAYRRFLKANGFSNAHVTIDSIDWYISSRLEARLKDNPNADVSGYRDYYIQSVLDIANYKHQLALDLGFRDLPHSFLVHHNVLNGLYLDDLMTALVADGWRFADAKDMFKHPIYVLEPETPTRGRSLLSALAQENGVADKGFPKAYYGFGEKTMDALGL